MEEKMLEDKTEIARETEEGLLPEGPTGAPEKRQLFGEKDEQWSEGGPTGDDRYGACEDVGGNDRSEACEDVGGNEAEMGSPKSDLMQGRAGNEERTQRYEVTQGATNSEDWNGFREAEKVPKNFLGKRRNDGGNEFSPQGGNERAKVRSDDGEDVDEFIRSMGWTNSFTHEPIRTKEEYDQFVRMNQAYEKGQDPVMTAKVNNLEKQLRSYAVKEQDAALLHHPTKGPIYKQYRDEVMTLIRYCGQNNIQNVDVNAAFATVANHHLDSILELTKKAAEKEAIQKIGAAANASVGSLQDNGDQSGMDIGSMPREEFCKLVEKVKRGEKIRV